MYLFSEKRLDKQVDYRYVYSLSPKPLPEKFEYLLDGINSKIEVIGSVPFGFSYAWDTFKNLSYSIIYTFTDYKVVEINPADYHYLIEGSFAVCCVNVKIVVNDYVTYYSTDHSYFDFYGFDYGNFLYGEGVFLPESLYSYYELSPASDYIRYPFFKRYGNTIFYKKWHSLSHKVVRKDRYFQEKGLNGFAAGVVDIIGSLPNYVYMRYEIADIFFENKFLVSLPIDGIRH